MVRSGLSKQVTFKGHIKLRGKQHQSQIRRQEILWD